MDAPTKELECGYLGCAGLVVTIRKGAFTLCTECGHYGHGWSRPPQPTLLTEVELSVLVFIAHNPLNDTEAVWHYSKGPADLSRMVLDNILQQLCLYELIVQRELRPRRVVYAATLDGIIRAGEGVE